MSVEFDDPELFADFIIEAKEHLETIEPNLLELEKSPDNLDLLNDIFRPMHSLKGASGFLGLNKINTLAHRGENVLDELRKGTFAITSEIMDTILSVTDALETMINNLSAYNTEGDNDYNELKDALDAILRGEIPNISSSSSSDDSSDTESAETTDAPQKADETIAKSASEVSVPVEDGTKTVTELITPKAWIELQKKLPSVKLNAFGQDHLKDFMEESIENVENINMYLLELEKDPTLQDNINDIFRYFHNIKGNSGIINYKELNNLTHEAETLLNKVRHGDLVITPQLVDLLLLVTDVMGSLIQHIDTAHLVVESFDVSELVTQLQKAIAGEEIALPASMYQTQVIALASNADAIKENVEEQKAKIANALSELEKNAQNTAQVDAIYNALKAVQEIGQTIKSKEAEDYANKTAGLVDQARKSDLDFSLMLDLLKQEVAIIFELIDSADLSNVAIAAPAPTESAKPATSTPAQTPPTEGAKPAAPAPAPATPAPKAAAKPAAKPADKKAGSAAPPAENKTASTIRVDHEKLDHLMNLIGELIINRNRYTMLARQLEGKPEEVNLGLIAQNLAETTYALARISDELQDTIMKVRMVPVSSVFSRFPRLVRDLSRKSNKDVDIILEGEETELDKNVVEVIGDPLVHLIRNSVDHGIESAEDRIAAGKSAKGTVTLRAFHKGNSVMIEIEDDGKGIDPEKMREVAVKKGIISLEDAKLLDDRDAVDLIFAPGFSSAAAITDISGRGVGMDVVRTNIKNLKGSVTTTTEIGKGTCFTLSLPLTLAIIDALMVEVAGNIYAIPLDAVSETTKIEKENLSDISGRKAVTLRGEVLGLVTMAELFNIKQLDENELPDMLSIVIIHDNGKRLGVIVDRLLERQEIVIKPLGMYLNELRGISGATIMGDGSVILILDPHEIYTMATTPMKGLKE